MANIINIGGGAGGSSGGGHTILDNEGTSLTQRAELQFKGAYSEDNSTDQVTEVNVVRSMTKAEFELLSVNEKQGIINVTDDSGEADRNYSETTLWSGSETVTTTGTQITLSDNISNYDDIVIALHANNSTDLGFTRFPVSELALNNIYIQDIYGANSCGCYFVYDTDNKITIKALAGARPLIYTKVIGIKYGNGTQTFHTYSTAEKIVGEWIDGKTVYEKTIVATNIRVNTSDWQNLEQISDIDTLINTEGTITILFNGQQTGIGTYFNVSVNSSGYVRFFCTAWNTNEANVYVTIRYTKAST